ncbi:uncharacterized protein BO88DRAFT_427301 [Aspergillus vadensis CBS 113365]|uniref:Uncharacterized protein n=1 Tax=Aspergillus vadensis (strain CBS 113365 / IMI 142717 / IBT 24658) TaxID=1448311 RepID=A0A319B345_ASPVC|nr:hypothetical protein BO88DRAFT_427301 [Aspergillus vadensis CBS 113365]PYH67157.1 hypothetical protein BO88DRAFT_427301 [Aspergillus vadensis CBS 113365]
MYEDVCSIADSISGRCAVPVRFLSNLPSMTNTREDRRLPPLPCVEPLPRGPLDPSNAIANATSAARTQHTCPLQDLSSPQFLSLIAPVYINRKPLLQQQCGQLYCELDSHIHDYFLEQAERLMLQTRCMQLQQLVFRLREQNQAFQQQLKRLQKEN